MSLFAHVGPGEINTWGFAYAFGVVGLISSSLLYVRGTVENRAARPSRAPIAQTIAAIGPVAIVIGGVCGVSFGLGFARIIDSVFLENAAVAEFVDDAWACCSAESEAFPGGLILGDLDRLVT